MAPGMEPLSATSFGSRTSMTTGFFEDSSFFFSSGIGIRRGVVSVMCLLPVHAIAKRRDMGDVMFAVPRVDRQISIERNDADFRMLELLLEVPIR